ncbi:MAG: hypothetical protein PHC62_00855 [Candidatus Izemoplasmatales bacterium]|nr:hypothetical protein [Candidatus Izemoplasmatales bacterium]
MARVDLIRSLYRKQIPIDEFKFDNIKANPLLSYIHPYAIAELYKIAKSVKLQSKPKEKYRLVDNIVGQYGFKRIASGTNRIVYKHLEDQRIVLKVALDNVGIRDNPNEFYNQQYLKPFVTKCFEVSPCGTVGIFERVQPITSREEFSAIAQDVFALLNKMIGKYILEDIGTKFFMNYGLREGFGPVLLDFPYMFELDGRKIHCNNRHMITGIPCNGEIDYDNGFNNLICTKCGKIYLATELEKDKEDNRIVIDSDPYQKGELFNMKIEIVKRTRDTLGRVVGEEKKITTLDTDRKETSSIVSKKKYEEGINVGMKTSKKPKIYIPNNIRSRERYKVYEPKARVNIKKNQDDTDETLKTSIEPAVKQGWLNPERANSNVRTRKEQVRSDVFAKRELTREEYENRDKQPIVDSGANELPYDTLPVFEPDKNVPEEPPVEEVATSESNVMVYDDVNEDEAVTEY